MKKQTLQFFVWCIGVSLGVPAAAQDMAGTFADSLPASATSSALSLVSPVPLPTSGGNVPWEAARPQGNPIIDMALDLAPNPLAKNWLIRQTKIDQNRYAIYLKLKRFHTGGAGESLAIFKTRAEALRRSGGFAQYQIEDYSEGIISETLGARRIAHGIVAFSNPESAAEKIVWPEIKPTKKTPKKPKLQQTKPATVTTNKVPVQEIDGVQLCLTPCADLLEK